MSTIGYTAKVEVSWWSYGDSPVYTTLTDCAQITHPVRETSKRKVTSTNQANKFHRYQPGMSEVGEAEVEMFFEDVLYELLLAQHGHNSYWRFTSPDDEQTVETFQGFITKGPTVSHKPDEDSMMKFSIQPTNLVTVS